MDNSEMYSVKAQQYEKQAQKKLKGSFFGNLVGSKAERAQEALELFKQAATNYKLAKRWDQAANAYLQCVQCDQQFKGGQAADYYVQAANMKQRVNTAECIKLLETSISLYVSNNRVGNVAKTQKRIAEIYEQDNQFTLAIKYYREAADNYSLEQNNVGNTNSCFLKVVEIGIFAAAPDYGSLIKTVAEKYMQAKLTAPAAKELYFQSVLLFLANDDSIGAAQALQRYINNDPTFYQTRQQKFCAALIKSVKEGDQKLFSDQCYKFNEIIPLDKWKTAILTRIKGFIPDPEAPAGAKTVDSDGEL